MSEERMRSVVSTMHANGADRRHRHRLVVVVGALLVVMASVIVGVTVWVVTKQTESSDPRSGIDAVVNYVGWEASPTPDARDAAPQPAARTTAADPVEETSPPPPLLETSPPDSFTVTTLQPSLTPFTAGTSFSQPLTLGGARLDYSQNVADVMKHLESQGHAQRGHHNGVRHGGTIQSYGFAEESPYTNVEQWPVSPNRMGQAFEGLVQPYHRQQPTGLSGSNSNTSPIWPSREHPTPGFADMPARSSPHGMGLRPLQSNPDRKQPTYYRRKGGGSGGGDRGGDRGDVRGYHRQPTAPPFRSRSRMNHTASDTTTSAGLDLAVSGWSAFLFGVFLIKKLLQIMGYGGRQSREVLDETDMFLHALDIAGRVAGFDASEELALLEQDVSLSSSAPEGRSSSSDQPWGRQQNGNESSPSRADMMNRIFGVGLNLVNLFTAEEKLNVAECLWGAYCEDLERRSREAAPADAIVAKVNTIGLQLIRGKVEDYIPVDEMLDMIRTDDRYHCSELFPACHGPRAVGFLADLLGSKAA